MSAQIHLIVEPRVFVYGLGGRDNLLFITASLIPGLHYQSVIRNTKVYKKEHSCISPQKFVISARRLLMNLLWLLCICLCFVLAELPWVDPWKGTHLLMATSELWGGMYLQIRGQILHWYNLALSPLETHQLPAVEIWLAFAVDACKSAASQQIFRQEENSGG